MPTNKKFDSAAGLSVICTAPASPDSGDPVLYGYMTGIALKDENSDGITPVDFSTGVWELTVVASAGAVAVGDALFLDATGATISNDSTGSFFGFAMEVIASGSAAIDVLHVESPGAASLGSGTVTATNLASNAVTTAKIAANAVTSAKIASPTTFIVVAKGGNDTTGDGSFAFPYATFAKAFTVWNATRHHLIGIGGDYEEAATLTWPAISGLVWECIGDVSVSNADAAAQVLLIQPGAAATTSFTATVKGHLNLVHDTQIGLKIANAAMTKKLIVELEHLSAEMETSGDSIDVAGTVAGQAIRLYADKLDLEGLLHFTVNDAGSRLRIGSDSKLMGGITTAGAVASEVTLETVTALTGGVTIAAEQKLTNHNCKYATDADPAVYTEWADAYATY